MNVTMDRYEADWEIVQRGWNAHVLGEAPHKFTSALEAVTELRKLPKANDQYLDPFVIVDANGAAVGEIVDNDAVVLFNYRWVHPEPATRPFPSAGLCRPLRTLPPSSLTFALSLIFSFCDPFLLQV